MMLKGINTLAVYIALLVFGVGFTLFFLLDIMPFFYPFMVDGDLWLIWPTGGVFGGIWGLLIVYIVQKTMGYDREANQWRNTTFICSFLH